MAGRRRTRRGLLAEAAFLVLLVVAAIPILLPGDDVARAEVEVEIEAVTDGDRLEGLGRVIDGDTLDVGTVRVRLHGIDAFERNQTCDRPQGPWACGTAATRAMKDSAEGRPLVCRVLDTDRYGRKVSRCVSGGVDVARSLVADGLALAYRRYSQDYVTEEASAEARGVGAWAGSFDRPEQWRSRSRRPPPAS